MNDTVIEIKMAQHRPRKPASVEYTTDEEDMIVYDMGEEIESPKNGSTEHHLQRAISAQQAYGHTGELVIPTPEVYNVPKNIKDELYPATYKSSRQLIHVQPFSMDQDIPDYDIDSEDERWLSQQAERLDIRPLQYEEMMDRLEKSSGQQLQLEPVRRCLDALEEFEPLAMYQEDPPL
ncbi:enhancer of polycomb homolog 1 [Trichonephila clavipes]|nr:enhancer of polycomb homolog 1 [Trichonephila clavipes]